MVILDFLAQNWSLCLSFGTEKFVKWYKIAKYDEYTYNDIVGAKF